MVLEFSVTQSLVQQMIQEPITRVIDTYETGYPDIGNSTPCLLLLLPLVLGSSYILMYIYTFHVGYSDVAMCPSEHREKRTWSI